MHPSFSKGSLGFLAGLTVIPLVAHAEIYLSEEQAVSAIFPSTKMERKKITLTAEEKKKIEELSGEVVRNLELVLWIDSKKNVIFIDQVLGKHEFITYAAGVTAEAKIKTIEIMEYRETYGQQVRKEEWRKQFIGKDVKSPLKVEKDIVNLSGATLSSVHVTNGVRRILHTYEIIRNRD